MQIPRVNDEVVVDFINGDPDRPLIIGRVYNEASMPPWRCRRRRRRVGLFKPFEGRHGGYGKRAALRGQGGRGAGVAAC